MDALRTPGERFADIPDFDLPTGYVETDVGRMAYTADGRGDETFLCLHGEPTWSFLYRKMFPRLTDRGRVIAPDLIGFGRSDKPGDVDDYGFEMESEALATLIRELDLTDVTLVCQDWGGILGLNAVREMPERFARVVPMNTGLPDGTQEMAEEWLQFRDMIEQSDDFPVGWLIETGCYRDIDDDVKAAYEAPFPDPSYKAGAMALPLRVPTSPDDEGADEMAATREFFADWQKPAYVLFSEDDPITRPSRDWLRELIPTADEQPDRWITDAGHFLQEDAGEEIADEIVDFVDRTPLDEIA